MVGLSSPPSPPWRHPRRFLSAAGVRKVAWWRRFRPFYEAAGPVRPTNRLPTCPSPCNVIRPRGRPQIVISDCIAPRARRRPPAASAGSAHVRARRRFSLHTAPRRDQSSSLSITIFFFFFFFGAASSFASYVLKEISHFSRETRSLEEEIVHFAGAILHNFILQGQFSVIPAVSRGHLPSKTDLHQLLVRQFLLLYYFIIVLSNNLHF